MSSRLVGCSFSFSGAATEQITTAGGNVNNQSAACDNTTPALAQLTDGSGSNKAQKVGFHVFTLSTTPTDVDLTAFAGSINDSNINFSSIKELIIQNLDPAISITLGNATSVTNLWTNLMGGTNVLGPQAPFIRVEHINGIPVTSNNKLLRLTAASGAPQAKVYLVGEGV